MVKLDFEFTCTCDSEGCTSKETTNTLNRAAFERELKKQGWLICNDGRTYCKTCREKALKSR